MSVVYTRYERDGERERAREREMENRWDHHVKTSYSIISNGKKGFYCPLEYSSVSEIVVYARACHPVFHLVDEHGPRKKRVRKHSVKA